MLVLSRQRDETIMIGDNIEITVVDIRGDRVRIGISAPREVQVHRKEIYQAIKQGTTPESGDTYPGPDGSDRLHASAKASPRSASQHRA